MKVYIAQLKCPSNHCVLAVYGEFADPAAAERELRPALEAAFDGGCRLGALNRECGICHATRLHVQVEATIFSTMAEAKGPLEGSARAQAASARFLKQARN